MEFEESFKQYLSKVKKIKEQLNDLTEEATKNALIMPFFSMLGYDVFDTEEFMPEFICDIGTKKGEKVDYAIIKDGEPIVLIEAKKASMKLQKQQYGQLYRYFTVNRCRLAILTNGITYQIFSDINTPNIMDEDPFLSFNLLEDDPSIYKSALKQFCKENFDIKNILSKAAFQKYEKVVIKTLKQDLISPSDEIVKYFLSRPEIKTGNRITAQMIEKHREITQKAMQKVLGAVISNEIKMINTQENITNNNENSTKKQKINQVTSQSPLEQLKSILKNFNYQEEDSVDFIKLHIYNSETTGIVSKKIGIVKMSKSDMQLTFKEPGKPSQVLNTIDDIKNYITSIN